jgi:hypothetical protein
MHGVDTASFTMHRIVAAPTTDRGDGTMYELIEQIAHALVDNPQKVKVEVVEGRQAMVLELKVAKEDIGKIIGKQGRTAQAMRTILQAASARANKRILLEILD